MTFHIAIHFIYFSIKTQQEIPYYGNSNKLSYICMYICGSMVLLISNYFLLILLVLLVFCCCCCCFGCTFYITILCNDQKKDKTFQ